MVKTTCICISLQFVSGRNEETSSQRAKRELKLTEWRHATVSERPVEDQKGIWQILNGCGTFASPLKYVHVCTGFLHSISFKWWIQKQTFLPVYFQFPNFSPSSDRIVNSVCPPR